MGSGKLWLFILILFFAAYWWAAGGANLPNSGIKNLSVPKSSQISELSGTWERIYRIIALKSAVEAKIDKRNYTPLRSIPLPMQQAIIAVEDNRFYRHIGFDVEGILRATLVNMQTGELTEGGSTITQQLVKNLFLSQEKTWGRKAEEIILAIDMEARYSKDEILELYLNTIYFGSGATGISQASNIYFNKEPSDLTLAESSLLAGLPNAPSLFSPYIDFAAAKHRQAIVLDAMTRYNYIGPETAQTAKTETLHLAR